MSSSVSTLVEARQSQSAIPEPVREGDLARAEVIARLAQDVLDVERGESRSPSVAPSPPLIYFSPLFSREPSPCLPADATSPVVSSPNVPSTLPRECASAAQATCVDSFGFNTGFDAGSPVSSSPLRSMPSGVPYASQGASPL